jgi:hypothetical protein
MVHDRGGVIAQGATDPSESLLDACDEDPIAALVETALRRDEERERATRAPGADREIRCADEQLRPRDPLAIAVRAELERRFERGQRVAR